PQVQAPARMRDATPGRPFRPPSPVPPATGRWDHGRESAPAGTIAPGRTSSSRTGDPTRPGRIALHATAIPTPSPTAHLAGHAGVSRYVVSRPSSDPIS